MAPGNCLFGDDWRLCKPQPVDATGARYLASGSEECVLRIKLTAIRLVLRRLFIATLQRPTTTRLCSVTLALWPRESTIQLQNACHEGRAS